MRPVHRAVVGVSVALAALALTVAAAAEAPFPISTTPTPRNAASTQPNEPGVTVMPAARGMLAPYIGTTVPPTPAPAMYYPDDVAGIRDDQTKEGASLPTNPVPGYQMFDYRVDGTYHASCVRGGDACYRSNGVGSETLWEPRPVNYALEPPGCAPTWMCRGATVSYDAHLTKAPGSTTPSGRPYPDGYHQAPGLRVTETWEPSPSLQVFRDVITFTNLDADSWVTDLRFQQVNYLMLTDGVPPDAPTASTGYGAWLSLGLDGPAPRSLAASAIFGNAWHQTLWTGPPPRIPADWRQPYEDLPVSSTDDACPSANDEGIQEMALGPGSRTTPLGGTTVDRWGPCRGSVKVGFEFELGDIPPLGSATLVRYWGSAPSHEAAVQALEAAGAQVYLVADPPPQFNGPPTDPPAANRPSFVVGFSVFEAHAVGPVSVCAGAPATFEDDTVPGLDPLDSQAWAWGDGTTTTQPWATTTLHTYTLPGDYEVGLVVRDAAGLEAKTSLAIRVDDCTPAPTAAFLVDPVADQDCSPTTLRAHGFAASLAGGPLHPLVNASLDFGDGTAIEVAWPPPAELHHTYIASEESIVTLAWTVHDDLGRSSTATRWAALCPNRPPALDPVNPVVVPLGTTVVLALRATDPDLGDVLTVRSTLDGSILASGTGPLAVPFPFRPGVGTTTLAFVVTDSGGLGHSVTVPITAVGPRQTLPDLDHDGLADVADLCPAQRDLDRLAPDGCQGAVPADMVAELPLQQDPAGSLPDDCLPSCPQVRDAGPAKHPRSTGPGADRVRATDAVPALALAGSLAALGLAVLAARGWGGLFVALFSRLRRSDLAAHPLRSAILQLVEAQPGLHVQELARRLGRSKGPVRHHVAVLESAGLVQLRTESRWLCVYPPGPMPAQRVARTQVSAELMRCVLERPGQSVLELARALHTSPGTVGYHVDRFERAGLVRSERVGRARAVHPVSDGSPGVS